MIVQAAGNCSRDGATTQITSSLGTGLAIHYIIITSFHTVTYSLSLSAAFSLLPEETIFVAKESTTPLVSPGEMM